MRKNKSLLNTCQQSPTKHFLGFRSDNALSLRHLYFKSLWFLECKGTNLFRVLGEVNFPRVDSTGLIPRCRNSWTLLFIWASLHSALLLLQFPPTSVLLNLDYNYLAERVLWRRLSNFGRHWLESIVEELSLCFTLFVLLIIYIINYVGIRYVISNFTRAEIQVLQSLNLDTRNLYNLSYSNILYVYSLWV